MRQTPLVKRRDVSRVAMLNLLASALTILATIVFLGATTMVGGTSLPAPAETDTDAAVRDFYEAINTVLRTGDSAALDHVVAPDVLLQAPPPGIEANRDGLKRLVAAMHVVAPGMQLAIEELIVAGDHAITRVASTHETAGSYLGVPFSTTPRFWGRVDALRSADGQVVELWGDVEQIPLLETLSGALLEPPLSSPQPLTFERLSSAPGDAWILESTFRSRVIYIDAGELTVAVDPASPAPAIMSANRDGRPQERLLEPGTRADVLAGEALVLSPDTRHTLHHSVLQPELHAYEVAFPRERYLGPLRPDLPEPATPGPPRQSIRPVRQTLVDTGAVTLPRDPLVVSFGRIVLPAGTRLALAETEGPLLLSVESGRLEIEARHALGDRGEPSPVANEAVAIALAAGEATIVPTGATPVLRAGGDELVVAFAVTILSGHAMPQAAS